MRSPQQMPSGGRIDEEWVIRIVHSQIEEAIDSMRLSARNGMPDASVTLIIKQLDKRFEAVDKRFAEQREDTNRRFEAMDKRFTEQREYMDKRFIEQREYMDKRFEAVDKRFEAVDKRFTEQHEYMDKRFDAFQAQLDRRFEAVDRRFAELIDYSNKRFEAVDKRFEDMNRRFAEQREDITKNGKRITFFSTLIIAFVTASLVMLGIVLSRIGG